jgi:hypothetical protein
MSAPADWSLPAASSSAPVLGSDQSACPADENYILISRPSCPTNGVHFSRSRRKECRIASMTILSYTTPSWPKRLKTQNTGVALMMRTAASADFRLDRRGLTRRHRQLRGLRPSVSDL